MVAASASSPPPADAALKSGGPNSSNSTVLSSFDTQHDDMLHDAQLDYYGKRLATCSSDRTIRIHEVDGGGATAHNLSATLKGHEGPVWQVAWAHPKFGHVLASCSYDGKVLVWKQETLTAPWAILYEHRVHTSSVNSVAWGPHEWGLTLACGSSDGKVSVLTVKEDGQWVVEAEFVAHQIGCNAVSWSPSAQPSSLITVAGGTGVSQQHSHRRLATGGSDNLIKIWQCGGDATAWPAQPEYVLEGHADWVRDVSWAPNIGLPCQYLASCSQDRTAIVWQQEKEGGQWTKQLLKSEKFPEALWSVSWSVAGNLLAVSGGDNKISLWKQRLDGQWECVTEMEDMGAYTAGQ